MKKLFLMVTTLLLVLALSACDDLCVGNECAVEEKDEVIIEPEVCELPNIVYDGECKDPATLCPTGEVYLNGECETAALVCDENQVLDNGACVDKVEPEVCDEVGTNLLIYEHINGHGVFVDREAPLLFEYELATYVKYQLSYLSCTCRDADLNYWQMMYIEVYKGTNAIKTISFGSDGGHYTGGMWGDSSPTPGGKTLEDFENEFIPWLVAQPYETLKQISVFKNVEYNGITNGVQIDAGLDDSGVDMIDAYTGSSVSTNNMIRIVNVLLAYHDEKY